MRIRLLGAVAVTGCTFTMLEAQSVVHGSVRAKGSRRPLAGAVVTVDGSSGGTGRTDKLGEFAVVGLSAGAHTLQVRATGFQLLEAKAELSGGDTLEVEFQLDAASTTLPTLAINAPVARPKQNFISSAEVEGILGSASDAYDIVQHLRPSYLRGRGERTGSNPFAPKDTTGQDEITRAQRTAAARSGRLVLPMVTIDGGPLMDLGALRQVVASTVKEIRFIPGVEATTTYGDLANGGVIVVVLKR